jgi:hypothetical protein
LMAELLKEFTHSEAFQSDPDLAGAVYVRKEGVPEDIEPKVAFFLQRNNDDALLCSPYALGKRSRSEGARRRGGKANWRHPFGHPTARGDGWLGIE